jgi:hypothetical protein
MFEIKVDQTHAIVEFMLVGMVGVDEMRYFVRELQEATLDLNGREIKIMADLRALRPASPDVANMIRTVQEFGIRSGVKRVAEVVESDVVALQLNRVARESGTDKILRRFGDEDSAREWLAHGDHASKQPSLSNLLPPLRPRAVVVRRVCPKQDELERPVCQEQLRAPAGSTVVEAFDVVEAES